MRALDHAVGLHPALEQFDRCTILCCAYALRKRSTLFRSSERVSCSTTMALDGASAPLIESHVQPARFSQPSLVAGSPLLKSYVFVARPWTELATLTGHLDGNRAREEWNHHTVLRDRAIS